MVKENFKCRFCEFKTSNWWVAEEHFINKHKKSTNKQKNSNKKVKLKKRIKKVKNILIDENKEINRNKNKILMEQRIIELIINATPSECYLKEKLDLFFKNQFIFQKGFYFNKQDFFYIADFYFPKKNLIIEVDGKYHQTKEQKDRDLLRELNLKKIYHTTIFRYTNEQICDNLFTILQDIQNLKDLNVISTQFRKHLKLTKKERFKCNFCPIVCKSLKKLQNHIKNTHKK